MKQFFVPSLVVIGPVTWRCLNFANIFRYFVLSTLGKRRGPSLEPTSQIAGILWANFGILMVVLLAQHWQMRWHDVILLIGSGVTKLRRAHVWFKSHFYTIYILFKQLRLRSKVSSFGFYGPGQGRHNFQRFSHFESVWSQGYCDTIRRKCCLPITYNSIVDAFR